MINVYTLENDKLWDDIVRTISGYDVFYLSSYSRAFEHQGAGKPLLIEYINKNEKAINVVFRRDVALDSHFVNRLKEGQYFDLSTPYGYGGFIGNITNTFNLIDEWNKYCIDKRYICEFVRFNLFSNYINYYDGEIQTKSHNVIRNLNMPIENMWMDFKQKVRKNVKRSNLYNLQVILDSDGKYLEDFLKIYYATMKRSNAEEEYYFPRNFFDTLNQMKDNVMYFHVFYENKIISTELVLYGCNNAYSFLGGTDNNYFDLRPNDFLKYEIIKWAKEKNLKNFVLGGGYGYDDGIFQYKSCFAPKGIVDFYIGKKIFNLRVYNELCKLRGIAPQNNLKSSSFFPEYRQI